MAHQKDKNPNYSRQKETKSNQLLSNTGIWKGVLMTKESKLGGNLVNTLGKENKQILELNFTFLKKKLHHWCVNSATI